MLASTPSPFRDAIQLTRTQPRVNASATARLWHGCLRSHTSQRGSIRFLQSDWILYLQCPPPGSGLPQRPQIQTVTWQWRWRSPVRALSSTLPFHLRRLGSLAYMTCKWKQQWRTCSQPKGIGKQPSHSSGKSPTHGGWDGELLHKQAHTSPASCRSWVLAPRLCKDPIGYIMKIKLKHQNAFIDTNWY